jgi:hypothetical protein
MVGAATIAAGSLDRSRRMTQKISGKVAAINRGE